jgi:hypothetical protein
MVSEPMGLQVAPPFFCQGPPTSQDSAHLSPSPPPLLFQLRSERPFLANRLGLTSGVLGSVYVQIPAF